MKRVNLSHLVETSKGLLYHMDFHLYLCQLTQLFVPQAHIEALIPGIRAQILVTL